ncbi:MAG: hypothetical protein IBJ11_09070 [Phycisphaerales bacterium]|nr:hypothetical protein [Phycisphaerales bacterium]
MTATQGRKSSGKVDGLMDQASAALVETRYFEAEALANEALHLAFQSRDFERMARICLPLQEARRQIRMLAVDSGKLVRRHAPGAGEEKLKTGLYLVEPPLVGADGRDLRDHGRAQKVPVVVVVREPKTRLGLWPVVMIGPVTVRARIPAPEGDKPTAAWMLGALEALGDEAIAGVEAHLCEQERVEHLLERLDTVVDHEKLHQRLEESCRGAAEEVRLGKAPPRRKLPKGLEEFLAEDDEDGDAAPPAAAEPAGDDEE